MRIALCSAMLFAIVFEVLLLAQNKSPETSPSREETTKWLASRILPGSYEWGIATSAKSERCSKTDLASCNLGIYHRREIASVKFSDCTLALETKESMILITPDSRTSDESQYVDSIDFTIVNKVALSVEGEPKAAVKNPDAVVINPGRQFIQIRFYSSSGLPDISRTHQGQKSSYRVPDTHIGLELTDQNNQLAKRITTAFEHLMKACFKPEPF